MSLSAIANVDALRQRAPLAVDDHPLLAIWELTQACDLVCAHCRACATTRRDRDELSTAEGKRLIDAVAAMGTPLMILTGGDPAKREDLVELVAYGAARGLAMALTPSGTPLMTDALVAAVKDAGLSRLAVSVDGPDAASHDAFRGVAGSFAESARILEAGRRVGLTTQVNSSIHGGNVDTIDDMASMVARFGAVLWGVFVVVPTGRAGGDLLLGADRLERALERLAEIAESAPFDVKTTAAPHFRRVLMQRHSPRARVGVVREIDDHGVYVGARGITDGVGIMFVSHRGDIFPSGFMPVKAGNVRQDDLAGVYRTSDLFRQLRDEDALGGKCGVCPFRRVCGGSRARAFAVSGDPMGEDPLCAYVPKDYVSGAPDRSVSRI